MSAARVVRALLVFWGTGTYSRCESIGEARRRRPELPGAEVYVPAHEQEPGAVRLWADDFWRPLSAAEEM